MILRTEVSNADVGTASESLLLSAASLANREIETVMGYDLCRLRSIAPVVTRGVGVLQDALAAAHGGRQLHPHLLDAPPRRDEVSIVHEEPILGRLHFKRVVFKAAWGRGFVNVIVRANRKCEETLQYKYCVKIKFLLFCSYHMIGSHIYLDVDGFTNPVTSGNDTICVPIIEKFRMCEV